MDAIYSMALLQIFIGIVLIFNKLLPLTQNLNPKNESLIPIIGMILIGMSNILLIIYYFINWK